MHTTENQGIKRTENLEKAEVTAEGGAMTVFKRKDGFDWVLKDGQHLGREREENEAAHLGNCTSKSKNGNESQLCPSDSEQPIPEVEVGQFPYSLCTRPHTHRQTQ